MAHAVVLGYDFRGPPGFHLGHWLLPPLMDTYLLTWNPNRWSWHIDKDLVSIRSHGYVDGRWSCGNTRRIQPGDQVYLLRQGLEPRGILASGTAISATYEDRHWADDRSGETALYVDVRFDSLLDPDAEGVLPLSRLAGGELASVNWRTQSSGISIPPKAAAELDSRWRSFLRECGQSPSTLPEEISAPALFFEGASRTVTVNAYERDPRARRACIEHYGATCVVCNFNFAATFGSLGEGFIHVHHVVPLSKIGKEYVIQPVRDLRPVCPNCHAMLHHGEKVLSIEDLMAIVDAKRRSSSRC